MTDLRTYRLDRATLDALAAVLAAHDMPISDLEEPGRIFFRFADDVLAGYGGLEGEGPDRLLRSFVVVPERRGVGLGIAMLAVLEQEAAAFEVERLHLLTTDAAPFFRAHGYVDGLRAEAPPGIAASAQFSSLCPVSAVYLVKSLDAA